MPIGATNMAAVKPKSLMITELCVAQLKFKEGIYEIAYAGTAGEVSDFVD